MAGLLDFLFGGQAQAANAPPAPVLPAATAAQTGGFPDQTSWLANHIKAMGDLARSRTVRERGLINLFTGRDANAAREAAQDQGPAEYFKTLSSQPAFQQADTAAKEGQLGLIQRLGQTSLVTGRDIDPNNIPASSQAYGASLRAQFPDLIGGAQTPPGVDPGMSSNAARTAAPPPVSAAPLAPPQGGAPQDPNAFMSQLGHLPPISLPSQLPAPPPGAASPQQPTSALEANRNYFDRIGKLQTILGNAKAAADYFNFARQGIPSKNAAVVNGRVVEGVTGAPLASGMTGQQFDAQGERLNSIAKVGPEYQAKLGEINAQLGADLTKTNNEKAQDYEEVYDKTSGEPGLVSKHDLAAGRLAPNFARGKPPTLEAQAKEVEASNKEADEAREGILTARTLVEATKGIYTGAYGKDVQDIRKNLVALGLGGEQMKTAADNGAVVDALATQLAGLQSRSIAGGRTPLGLYNTVLAVKPGLLSTNPEAVAAPIIAAFQRRVDQNGFKQQYYGDRKNWNKLDADTQFQKANPDQKYLDLASPKAAPPPLTAGDRGKLSVGDTRTLKGGSVGTWNGHSFDVVH